jgi:hypothetical protein
MEKQKTYKEGRRCPVCGNKLSRYNEGPNCYSHQPGVGINICHRHSRASTSQISGVGKAVKL